MSALEAEIIEANRQLEKHERRQKQAREEQHKAQVQAERHEDRIEIYRRRLSKLHRQRDGKDDDAGKLPTQRNEGKHLTPKFLSFFKTKLLNRGEKSVRQCSIEAGAHPSTGSRVYRKALKELSYEGAGYVERNESTQPAEPQGSVAESANKKNRSPDFRDTHLQVALRLLEDNDQATLSEMADAIEEEKGIRYDTSTISRHLCDVGLSSKAVVKIGKRWNAPEVIQKRKQWVNKLQELKHKHLLFVDDSPFNTLIRKAQGRRLPGRSSLQFVPDSRGLNRTLLTGIFYPARTLKKAPRQREGMKKRILPHFLIHEGGIRYQSGRGKARLGRRGVSSRERKEQAENTARQGGGRGHGEPAQTEASQVTPATRARGVTSRHVCEYLEHVRDQIPENTTLVWDNVSIHKSEETMAYLERMSQEIEGFEVLFLPQYSPFLNPIEYLFGGVKRHVRVAAPRDDTELYGAIELALVQLNQEHTLRGYWRRMKKYLPTCAAGDILIFRLDAKSQTTCKQ